MDCTDVILCIDRGTTELKVILFDKNGNNRGMERRKCSILPNRPDWLETDLDETYLLLKDACSALSKKAEENGLRIICISITSYMSGTIFVDENGNHIGTAVLWNDSRTQKLTAEWEHNGTLQKNFDLTGSQILTGWPIPLLKWWKDNNPEVLEKATRLLNMKDWIRFKLCGSLATDVTEAVLSPGDVESRGYSDKVIELFDVSEYKHLLPIVEEPEAIAGYLLPEVANELKLESGIPVVIGIGDMPSGVLGAGALLPGHGSTVLGTTFLNGLILDRPQREPYMAGMTSAYVNKRILRMVNNTGGAAINYQWFIDNFFAEEKDKLGSGIYNYIDNVVSSVQPGANGVMYHPYINSCGVTAPFLAIGARAQFTGIGLHTKKDEMLRAIYEGIGFALRDCFSSVPEKLVDITLTGGGSKSPVLCQIAADICGVPIRIPEEVEATALGTAIVGAVGIGLYDSYDDAVNNMVHFKQEYLPNISNKQLYDDLYSLYFSIRQSMMPVWEIRREIL